MTVAHHALAAMTVLEIAGLSHEVLELALDGPPQAAYALPAVASRCARPAGFPLVCGP